MGMERKKMEEGMPRKEERAGEVWAERVKEKSRAEWKRRDEL